MEREKLHIIQLNSGEIFAFKDMNLLMEFMNASLKNGTFTYESVNVIANADDLYADTGVRLPNKEAEQGQQSL